MALYSGRCEGGPFDGKNLHHGSTTCSVALKGNRVVTWFGPSTAEIAVGQYLHQNGIWRWKP